MGLKTYLSEKVSSLDISCSEIDVRIKKLEREVASYHSSVEEKVSRLKELENENASVKEDVLFHQKIFEKHNIDLQWLLKHGIPLFSLDVLNLEEFRHHNAYVREAAFELGQHQVCIEMVARYPKAFVGIELPYSFLSTSNLVLQCFSELRNFNFSSSFLCWKVMM